MLSVYRAIFTYAKPTITLTESFDYDSYWKRKRGTRLGALSVWQKARADILITVISKQGGTSIGDIGCGDGSILSYIRSKVPSITTLIGYDTSEVALQIASETSIQTKVVDLNRTGWSESLEVSDYLLALETVEHVPHSEEVVATMLSKAKKGIFISVPNSGYFTYRLRLLFGKFPSQWLNFPNEHVRFWTAADMQWWLKAQGYTDASLYLYRGVPVLNKILPNIFAAGQVVYIPRRQD